MPKPKSTKPARARKAARKKNARTLTIVRPPPPFEPHPTHPAYLDGKPKSPLIPWVSPEVQRINVQRLGSLAGEWAMTFDVVQGQDPTKGGNDPDLIRDGARVLKALAFAAVTKDEAQRAIVGELGAAARAYLNRDGVRGQRLTEDGTPLAVDDYDTRAFACGGDVEVTRRDALSELHAAMIGWLEGGASEPVTAYEAARYTCLRVNAAPSSLRELARRNGFDLGSEREAGELGEEFKRVRSRKDAPKELWRLAQRLLARAAIRWGMPEAEAFKLFDFQRKRK